MINSKRIKRTHVSNTRMRGTTSTYRPSTTTAGLGEGGMAMIGGGSKSSSGGAGLA